MENKMTIIRSRVLQILLILMSITMFLFSVISFFYIEDDKYLCIADGVFLGILFLVISTGHIKYDDEIILYKLWVVKKQINIKGIKEVNYSGIPNLFMLYNYRDTFYLPVLWNKKKVKKLIEFIKYINPEVEINVSI